MILICQKTPEGVRSSSVLMMLSALLVVQALGCRPCDPRPNAGAGPTSAPATTSVRAELAQNLEAAPLGNGASAKADHAASERTFGDVLGLGVKFSQGQPQSDLPMLLDLGVRWVRDGVSWPILEPTPGRYEPMPEQFVERLDYYRTHDIGLIFMLAYGNAKAYPPTEAEPFRAIEPVAFSKYALHVARELKKAGVRFVLEVWNEPHNFQIRPTVGGEWNGRPPSPWIEHYLKMVRETVERVKEFDQEIKILSDEDMWVLHYWFLEGGLPSALDGFAFHPYVPGAPEIAAVAQDTDWMVPFVAVDPDRSFGSAVRRLREQGQKKLGKVPEMWITEWGWPVEHGDRPLPELTVASYLPRAFILAAAAGVEVMCWFSSQDSVDGPMGLTTNDGRKRASYRSYKFMSEKLGALQLEQHLIGKTQPTVGVQAFRFTSEDADTETIVIWDLAPVGRRLSVSGPLAKATVFDSQGALVQPSGARQVRLSSDPLYLVGASRNTLLADLIR